MKNKQKKALIIGAGPAGLTAGLELSKTGEFEVTIIEKEKVVGGLSRTTKYKGCRFDIGPHHFITESDKILEWWKDIMGSDFHELKRTTHIFYKKHFFKYPLEPLNVLRGLSIFECTRCVLSYLWIRLFPIKNPRSLQDWITNRFGHYLFSIFFKTYSEKLWGIPCSKISSVWASQRIKGFSLSKAIFYGFFGRWFEKNKPRTIWDVFYYPSLGAGTLWEKVAEEISNHQNTSFLFNSDVTSVEHKGRKIVSFTTHKIKRSASKKGAQFLACHKADYFFSTMPLRNLILSMDPPPPESVINAASQLKYRGLVLVHLIVNKPYICPDHWLYIHEKEVKTIRIGIMTNFSSKMVVNPTKQTALSLEYFTFSNESFWKKPDKELLEIGKAELAQTGLAKPSEIADGMVMRVPESYPIYDEDYKKNLNEVLEYLSQFKNLFSIGRNGLHRYNNMDISMISAMEAVEKVIKIRPKQMKQKIRLKKSALEA
jgi:protoporphyrinogen oxidase